MVMTLAKDAPAVKRAGIAVRSNQGKPHASPALAVVAGEAKQSCFLFAREVRLPRRFAPRNDRKPAVRLVVAVRQVGSEALAQEIQRNTDYPEEQVKPRIPRKV